MTNISSHNSSRSHQQGFTLLELLVYIAVSAIVVVIAGQVWLQFTKASKKTTDKMNAYQEIEQSLFYLDEDISRTGSKANSTGNGMDMMGDVFLSGTDSSSIDFTDDAVDGLDEITFRAANFAATTSEYTGYDIITYSVNDDKELIRSGSTVDTVGNSTALPDVVVMDSVVEFDLNFGVYASEGKDFTELGEVALMTAAQLAFIRVWNNNAGPDNDPVITTGTGGYTDITNFDYGDASTADTTMISVQDAIDDTKVRIFNGNDNGTLKGIIKGRTYKVTFNTKVDTEFSNNFDIVNDSMSVVIGKATSAYASVDGVPEHYFYGGLPDTETEREFYFTANVDEPDPSFFLRFALKSDLSAGVFSIGALKIEEMNSGSYNFVTDFTGDDAVLDKQNVRSMTLKVVINHGSNVDGQDQVYTLRKFIQLPNNGVR